jgi:hypothetical protein
MITFARDDNFEVFRLVVLEERWLLLRRPFRNGPSESREVYQ